jgi:hypothetical protein
MILNDIEFEWIEACKNASLTYCKKGKHHDYKLTYPSIEASEHFHIPTKRGYKELSKSYLNFRMKDFIKLR